MHYVVFYFIVVVCGNEKEPRKASSGLAEGRHADATFCGGDWKINVCPSILIE